MEVNEAFNLLNIGRLDKSMIIRKLRQLAKAYDAETSVKVIGSSLTDVFFQLFENHIKIFDKCARCAVLRDTDKIIVFSDVYEENENIRRFVSKLSNDFDIRVFNIGYAKRSYKDGFLPPNANDFHSNGYKILYRGVISGVVF